MVKYFQKCRQIDALIRRKATGDQNVFSTKLSKSTLNYYIKEMKELGSPIRYCRKRGSYYYDIEGRMVDHLFYCQLTNEELVEINGGAKTDTNESGRVDTNRWWCWNLRSIKKYIAFLLIMASLPFIKTASASIYQGKQSETMVTDTSKPHTLLWKIQSKDGAHIAFLFGTIHMVCRNDFKFPSAVDSILPSCNKIFFEFNNQSDSTKKDLVRKLYGSPEYLLKNNFTDEQYISLSNLLRDSLHLNLDKAKNLKPLGAMFLVMQACVPCKLSNVGVETLLREKAKTFALPVAGLENMAEAYSVASEDSAYAATTIQLINNLKKEQSSYGEMLKLYQEADIYSLQKISSASGGDLNVVKRNEKWLEKIEAQIKKETTFFAVGAAHLAGSGGLIELLRKDGFIVSPVL